MSELMYQNKPAELKIPKNRKITSNFFLHLPEAFE
jgi:hypothetical protein